MKSFYFLLLMAVTLCVKAQNKPKRENNLQRYLHSKLNAKLNLLSMIDFKTPTLQPEIEYRFNPHLSAGFTVGIPLRMYKEIQPTDSTYSRYYKLKAELLYFPGTQGFYVGPEISYLNRSYSRYKDHFVGEDGKTYDYDYSEVKKSAIAAAVKIGAMVPFRADRRLLMDVFVATGLRFTKMTYSSINLREGSHAWWMWNDDHAGSRTTPHLGFGLRLIYVIY